MHDRLLANTTHLSRADLKRYAQDIGLDVPRFQAELDDEIYRQRVREHQEGARRSYLRTTPGFFVNGILQDGSGGIWQHLNRRIRIDQIARTSALSAPA